MTLEQLIEAVRARDAKVNNLFELDDGEWRCSLRDEKTYNLGKGSTPQEAMSAALAEFDLFKKTLADRAARQPRPIEVAQIAEDIFG